MRICSVEGCSNKYYGNGFCRRHHDEFAVLNKMEEYVSI